MTKTYVYQLVSRTEGTKYLTSEELSATFLVEDFQFGSKHPDLNGQPKLKGYLGPMYNGTKDDKTVIRYETQEVYNALSC